MTVSKPKLNDRLDPRLLNPDRLIFVTDGVFAITLTLLVLDLKLPIDTSRSVDQSLTELIPRLAIYLFAFATIANQWTIHHRTFRLVQHADANLVALSLAHLLFITLIPASAALVGAYPTATAAANVYAVNGIMLCLSAVAVWWYVSANHHLLAEDADRRLLTGIALVWALVAVGFLVSIAVGLWSVVAEYAVWVGWSPVVSVWWYRRRRELGA